MEKRESIPRSCTITSLSSLSTALGGGPPRLMARMPCRASDVRAAASTPLPHTSPITATQASPTAKRS